MISVWRGNAVTSYPAFYDIGLLTCLSNGEDCEDTVFFARTRKDFLLERIALENGIPSHDTFNRVFFMLSPDVLPQCLDNYGKDMTGLLSGKQICPDGKKLKGCNPRSRGNRGLYIVNAWASEHRVCTGRKKAEDGSNETEAIPALLEETDIRGLLSVWMQWGVSVRLPTVLFPGKGIVCRH
ncbi:MAG: ISAs1 family transposase [Dysgonamonadaceae bacterium]|jgi:hypothetical protein|nr:ISAs1 family transposase [Dysgonamonadaceae bacterium]